MIGTLQHIVSQMNINSDTFTFEYGKRGYINVLEDELLLPAVIYDTESVFNLTPSQSGFIGEGGRAILSFMYKSELEWTPKQHYDNCIEPAINAARQFISLCQASELIEEISVGDGREFINLLDKNTSGIQFPFSIKLRVDKNVCVDYTPSDNCQPVILTINGVEVETILSGTVFPLKVTLDGTQSGAYNEATDTWEVESEPCPPCEIEVTFDNIPLATVTESPYNIDCDTPIQIVIVTDCVSKPFINGTYVYDGVNLIGNPIYTQEADNTVIIFNDGVNYIMGSGGNNIKSNDAPTYPWEADWGGQATVVQGTISDYCGGTPTPCADATYTIKDRNNRTLYSGSIASGGDLQQYIENTTIEVNDSSFADVEAQGYLNIKIDYEDGSVVPTTIVGGVVGVPDNRRNSSSIGKTGQTTSYATNDDGDLERGNGPSFFTLNQNNPYGNTNRFTDELGGQTYTNNIVIDWANCDYINKVVAGWYRVPISGNVTWANAMSGQPYSQGGYNWYIPNRGEPNSILNFEVVGSRLNYAPFNIISSDSGQGFWTSTTNPDFTSSVFRIVVDADLGAATTGSGLANLPKTNTANRLLFRYFTFSELGP